MAYSIGASVARKASAYIALDSKLESGAVLISGLWFFVASVCDLYFSTRTGGWHWMFLPLALVPAGLGAYLVLLALTMCWAANGRRNVASADGAT